MDMELEFCMSQGRPSVNDLCELKPRALEGVSLVYYMVADLP